MRLCIYIFSFSFFLLSKDENDTNSITRKHGDSVDGIPVTFHRLNYKYSPENISPTLVAAFASPNISPTPSNPDLDDCQPFSSMSIAFAANLDGHELNKSLESIIESPHPISLKPAKQINSAPHWQEQAVKAAEATEALERKKLSIQSRRVHERPISPGRKRVQSSLHSRPVAEANIRARSQSTDCPKTRLNREIIGLPSNVSVSAEYINENIRQLNEAVWKNRKWELHEVPRFEPNVATNDSFVKEEII